MSGDLPCGEFVWANRSRDEEKRRHKYAGERFFMKET